MTATAERKSVIITGANGNLGRVVTGLFLDLRYQVVAIVHNESGKKEFPSNDLLQIEVADLSDEDTTQKLITRIIEQKGKIYGALLLAGGFVPGKIIKVSTPDIRKMISLNFETAYTLTRNLLPHMIENDFGRLVFMGARAAIKPDEGKNSVAYGLSKSLLFTLAEYINAESKGKDITATVIVPSTIDTIENRKAMPDADFTKWVQARDLAAIMNFILSGESSALRETVLKVYNKA
jgi:NAD(P)-dependent dehydrogenase (short-subunit alcohol dehydrogenase family)